MISRSRFVVAVMVLALVASPMTAGPAMAQGKTVKVGFLSGFTSVCAPLTESNLKGVRLGVEQINAAGGLLGDKIDLLVRDTKTQPDEGVLQMRRLLLEDKVPFVLGPCSSAVNIAISQLSKQFKRIQISSVANTHRATEELGHKYYFQVVPNTRMEARAVAQIAAKQPWKRWVTIGLDYEWGHVGIEAFLQKMKELRPDIEVVKQYWPKIGETDYNTFITGIQADKPDAVIAFLFGPALINFTRQARGLGLYDQVKSVVSLYSVDMLKPMGAETPLNQLGWARAPFFALEGPAFETFFKQYRERYNNDIPDDWAVMGYDAVMLLRAGVEKSKSLDPDKVADALSGITLQSLRGPITVRAADHMASVPVFVGWTAESKEYPFRVFRDTVRVPGDQLWLSESELKKR
ncbi:MAG: ABC transporter substrate-binding protein [Burkholderiales bacterium]|nr:ABC transporter substrate-binding protein [Burkholderiales bacterium]